VKTARGPLVAIGIFAVSSLCGVTQSRAETVTDVLPGVWDWEAAPQRCQENPHSIDFTPDRKSMEVRHPKGAVMGKETPRVVTVYRVLSESPSSLRMRIVGESRRTDAGEPVVWDLVLLSRDSYCWHRTDWPPQGCTGRVLRCSAPSN